MSRSFGDRVAHSVGVSEEAEIKEFNLNDNDKFVILASDGLWDFLHNQDVWLIIIIIAFNLWECKIVKMVYPFYLKNNPEAACEKLIIEANLAWKRVKLINNNNNYYYNKEGDVIDDTTVVIIFLKSNSNANNVWLTNIIITTLFLYYITL